MERYKNSSGKSNVSTYEIGSDFIKVKFKGTSKVYRYSNRKAGIKNVNNMKLLAVNGSGLNSYINSCESNLYD